jgi:hypothetical protein
MRAGQALRRLHPRHLPPRRLEALGRQDYVRIP